MSRQRQFFFVFECLTYCSVLPHHNLFRFDPERATSLAFLVINELVEVSTLFFSPTLEDF